MTLIKISNLNKSYKNEEGTAVQQVLNQLNLSIEQGESVAITGPSGSGKSTLLNLLGTLDSPDSGSLLVNETELSQLSENETEQYRNQKIGFVFQQHHLLPQLSLWENALLPTLATKTKQNHSEVEARCTQLFETVGLSDKVHKRPGQLSVGECQRAAVVRALVNKPDILLADEPTGALDEENAQKLVDLLLELNQKEAITLLMVTHDNSLAQKLQRTYRFSNGNLQEQKPENI